MAKVGRRGLDEPQLEGGGGGGGMGRGSSTRIKEVPMDIKGAVEAAEKYQAKNAGASIKGTKYSSLPSFKGNASTLGDIKKLTADSSHLKGGAKQAVDEAKGRAAKRTAVRAAGAAAAGAGAKSMMGETASAKDSDSKDDGAIEATFRKSKDREEESPEMATHYKPDNYKSGGMASSRADGIAQRGKTRGKVC